MVLRRLEHGVGVGGGGREQQSEGGKRGWRSDEREASRGGPCCQCCSLLSCLACSLSRTLGADHDKPARVSGRLGEWETLVLPYVPREDEDTRVGDCAETGTGLVIGRLISRFLTVVPAVACMNRAT